MGASGSAGLLMESIAVVFPISIVTALIQWKTCSFAQQGVLRLDPVRP
jgi:hypothetical protein